MLGVAPAGSIFERRARLRADRAVSARRPAQLVGPDEVTAHMGHPPN
jgi:hypothetical protein